MQVDNEHVFPMQTIRFHVSVAVLCRAMGCRLYWVFDALLTNMTFLLGRNSTVYPVPVFSHDSFFPWLIFPMTLSLDQIPLAGW